MSEKQKRTLRRMGKSSSNWSKYGIPDVEQVPYINKDFDEDCKYDVNSNVNNEKKNKEIENNKKGGNKINELIDYFNEFLSSDDEEEMELWNYTAGKNIIEPLSYEEEYEEKEDEKKSTEIFRNVSMKCENCDKKTLDKLFDYFDEPFSNENEEEENENVNTCCGQYISKIESQQEIEQNTEDVKIPKRICKFQPTTYKNFKPKETMKIVCPDNTNNKSFVSFDPEKAKQKKAKENELKKQTLEYLEGFDASQTVRNELMNNDKKFYWLMEKFSNETTSMNDVALKIATELMSPKIKRKKLFVDRDARGKNCRYKHVDADDSWQIEISEGGWFEKNKYRIENVKSPKNAQPYVTHRTIGDNKFTFILK